MQICSILLRGGKLAGLLVLAACGSGKGPTGNGGGGSITLTLNPPSASINRGGSVVVTGTIDRGGGFTGDVAIAITGAATGITGTVTTAPTNGGNSAVVTLSVGSDAAPGVDTIVVHASGSGVATVTAMFVLTITLPQPSMYALAIDDSALVITQGASGAATVTLTRTNYSGAVTLTVDGLPAGISASVAANPVAGTSATVTFTATTSASPGTFPALLRGSASGLADVMLPLSVTVTPAPGFTLRLTSPAISVTAGASATTSIIAARLGGLATSITYTASGMPAGLAILITSTAVADSNLITATAASNTAAGTYPITLQAAADTVVRGATLMVTVSAPAMIRRDYSNCTFLHPVWMAYQDGDGPWTEVQPVNLVWTFPAIQSATGAYVEVFGPFPPAYTTYVQYGTREESSGWSYTCPAGQPYRTLTGTVAGLGAQDHGYVSLGESRVPLSAGASDFHIYPTGDGPQDLVGYRTSGSALSAADRMIIRRDLQIPDGGSVGVVDFNGAEAVMPVGGMVTVTDANVPLSVLGLYSTGSSCTNATLYSLQNVGASFLALTAPASIQRNTDLTQLSISAYDGSTTRSVTVAAHTLNDMQLALGPELSPAAEMVLPGAYKRLQLSFAMLPGYQSASFNYGVNSVYFYVSASAGYLAGQQNVTLTAPDFSGVSGFVAGYFPSSATNNQYSLSLSSTAPALCGAGVTRTTLINVGP